MLFCSWAGCGVFVVFVFFGCRLLIVLVGCFMSFAGLYVYCLFILVGFLDFVVWCLVFRVLLALCWVF